MLDLKAKLAAAGLVTKDDVARAEAAKANRRGGKPQTPPPPASGLKVSALRGKNKGEIYDAVRRFVDKVRLDPVGAPPSESARAFHFPLPTGKIGRLMLEPELAGQLEDGRAALVSYMSNHGLAHAVVLAAHGREIAELMPLWLRVLVGDERAGAMAEEPAKRDEPRK